MRIVPILIAGAALLIACEAKVTLHHFVIPHGYTGPIAMVSDTSFSSRGGYWEQERYVHLVPLTAVACVSPDNRLGAHQLSAEYSDGSAIYSYGAGRVHPPNEKSIRIESFGTWGGDVEGSFVTWLGVGDAETVGSLKKLFFARGIENQMPPNVHIDRHDRRGFGQFGPHCATGILKVQ